MKEEAEHSLGLFFLLVFVLLNCGQKYLILSLKNRLKTYLRKCVAGPYKTCRAGNKNGSSSIFVHIFFRVESDLD